MKLSLDARRLKPTSRFWLFQTLTHGLESNRPDIVDRLNPEQLEITF